MKDTITDILIHYINAYCGAGKTYGAAKHADRIARCGRKVLLVQPTTQLVSDTIQTTFPQVGVTAPYRAITSATHAFLVLNTIDEYLKTTDPDKGEILIITHSAFFALSYFHNPGNWIVIIDEIPAVERSFRYNIPDAHELLTEHLDVIDRSNTAYWRVAAKGSGTRLKQIARNANEDEVFASFSGFATTVLSEHWDVYVTAENYNALVGVQDVPGISRQLIGSALMSPTVFKDFHQTIIAGACFTESLLYLIWSRCEHPGFKVHFENLTGKFPLRYEEHRNGHLIDIHYALDTHWSKNMRDKAVRLVDGSSTTVWEAINDKARAMIGSEKVAVLANNDRKGFETAAYEDPERLPNMSHGLNTYQGIDHAVLLAAINPHPAHFRFLQEYAGIDPVDVQTAMYRQTIYQAACRTSIRDPHSTSRKKWFVADGETATWLQGLFKGARTHALDLFDPNEKLVSKGGRPRIHADEAAKQKAYRERKQRQDRIKLERMIRLDCVNEKPGPGDDRYEKARIEIVDRMGELANIKRSPVADRTRFQGTFFGSVEDNSGRPAEGSFDELVAMLRDCSEDTFGSKEDCLLWSPSHYVEHPLLDTKRGYGNVAYARNVILDNDGGDLTPNQFAALFPDWRMAIYSTWSSSAAKPKWRVLIPTDALMDIEGYKLVCQHIIARLNARGFWSETEIEQAHVLKSRHTRGTHGFDASKLNPASVLYLPSKGANPADAFFLEIDGESRGPLDVYDVIAQAPLPKEPLPVPSTIIVKPSYEPIAPTVSPQLAAVAEALRNDAEHDFRRNKQRRIEVALDGWHTEGDWPGRRDRGYWQLAVGLKHAGCDASEIGGLLREAATRSGSREKGKLVSGIKRIVKSLMVP